MGDIIDFRTRMHISSMEEPDPQEKIPEEKPVSDGRADRRRDASGGNGLFKKPLLPKPFTGKPVRPDPAIQKAWDEKISAYIGRPVKRNYIHADGFDPTKPFFQQMKPAKPVKPDPETLPYPENLLTAIDIRNRMWRTYSYTDLNAQQVIGLEKWVMATQFLTYIDPECDMPPVMLLLDHFRDGLSWKQLADKYKYPMLDEDIDFWLDRIFEVGIKYGLMLWFILGADRTFGFRDLAILQGAYGHAVLYTETGLPAQYFPVVDKDIRAFQYAYEQYATRVYPGEFDYFSATRQKLLDYTSKSLYALKNKFETLYRLTDAAFWNGSEPCDPGLYVRMAPRYKKDQTCTVSRKDRPDILW